MKYFFTGKMKKQALFTFIWNLLFGHFLFSQDLYELDPAHTLIQFNVERFMVGEVSGSFTEFLGQITIHEETLAISQVEATIQASSLDTNHEVRDGHLRSPMWLDTESFPEIRFESDTLLRNGEQQTITGWLTIKDEKKFVSFPIQTKGPFKDPTGAKTLGLSANLAIDRQDYGIRFSKAMDNGELFIGNTVNIRIRALAILKE